MNGLTLRLAAPGDLDAINAIYNHYVLVSTCTYQTEPETAADRRAWFDAHDPARHPVTVAEEEDGRIAGWGSLSSHKSRCGYRHSVESSVYVHHERHRRGVGSALLADLLARAIALGHHTVVAGIDTEQEPSLRLHERFGFEQVAHFRQVGRKFGRWLDVIYMQRMLPAT
jgi:L-amino acid N-acyltransferase